MRHVFVTVDVMRHARRAKMKEMRVDDKAAQAHLGCGQMRSSACRSAHGRGVLVVTRRRAMEKTSGVKVSAVLSSMMYHWRTVQIKKPFLMVEKS